MIASLRFLAEQVLGDSYLELLTLAVVISAFATAYRHIECHQGDCHRLGRFTHGHLKLCGRHHPLVNGKVTATDIDAVGGKAMTNTAEVTDLRATSLTGAVKLTWGVSNTSYLESFVIVVTKNGTLVEKITIAASKREETIKCEGTGWSFNVEAIVAQGGKVTACNPLPVEPAPEPPKPTGVAYGLVLNADQRSALSFEGIKAVGAKLLRMQASVAEAKQFIAEGCEPLIIIGSVSAAAQWKGVVKYIEVFNESNYSGGGFANSKAGGEAYGKQVLEVIDALAGSTTGVLVQASDAGVANSGWIDGLFAAVPNLDSLVAGYTIHPYYGGAKAGQKDTWGIPMMERMVAGLEKYKAVKPIAVTEWGETSANGKELSGKPSDLTFAEAAEIVTQEIPLLFAAAKGRVGIFTVYCAHDLHSWATESNWENFFGVVDINSQPKPPYTEAVKTLLAT
jgi:hypothetical protein